MKWTKLVKANEDLGVKEELQEILNKINNEQDLFMSEVVYLQEHKEDIKRLFPNESQLWQAADIPEEEWNNHQASKQVKAQEEVTVTIPMSLYISWLSKELNEANELWGGEASVALAPRLLELIEEVGPGKNSDPDYIADNFVVNGEFVEKEEFKEGGNHDYFYKKYNGDWQALCDDALVYDENYACMQF